MKPPLLRRPAMYEWLDKHIENQREQREALDKISYPYTAAELCEEITELDEMLYTYREEETH
jgi:hypothetical protein